MWFPLILAAFVLLNSVSNARTKYLQKTADADYLIYDKYIEQDKSVKNLVNNGVKMALPYIMEASEHVNLSASCTNNLFALMSGIKMLKLSAVKFLDASGKIPAGVLTGTLSMLGDYDECLGTEYLRANGKVAFRGQYCMLDIKAILPKAKRKLTINGGFEELLEYTKNTSEVFHFLLSKVQHTYARPVKYGLCVPSGCTTEDVTMMLNYLGEKAFTNAKLQYCDQEDKFQMHPGTIAAISFFSVAGLLAIVGSSMEYYSRKKGVSFERKTAKILMCFSVPANFPKVISTKTQDSALSAVFGIRTLSLFFIILMHQYFYWGVMPVHGHTVLFEKLIPDFFYQVAFNGFLTTEVFFFLGGLLNTYSRMKAQESGKHKPTILQIFIHRLWRIFPTYIFSMLTCYLFMNARGPMGTFVRQEFIESCDGKWWKNLLFINNLFDQEKPCMTQTWYIAVDMQLFLLSLFTVPVLLKKAKAGIILHVGILILGLATAALWAWHKDIMPSLLVYYLDLDDIQRMRNAYVSTLPHVAPYFAGLIVGYILSKWNEFKIPKIYRLLGWPVAAACFLSMFFMTKKWNSGVKFTMIESALYFAFCRLIYVLSIAWIVVCCAGGYGGVVNYILSLKIWIPFSRLSYMVYMISPTLQLYYFGSLKMRIDNDYMTLIWRHIGDLGLSCLMGLAMVVIIESPFISMEKLIFHRTSTRSKERSPNNTENAEKYTNKDEVIKEIELEENGKITNEILNIEVEKNVKNMTVNI